MRVLVCGGRRFEDRRKAFQVLDATDAVCTITCIIEGGAEGADKLAAKWAVVHDVELVTFNADWRIHGRAAGPIRNKRMLDEGKPDLIVAFPGGRGTANMIEQGRKAGVRVIEPLAPPVSAPNPE